MSKIRVKPGNLHFNIYVQSEAAGQRVLSSVTKFLEGKLKLRVNRDKSAVAPVVERKFLATVCCPAGDWE
jgi:hypothetical protein